MNQEESHHLCRAKTKSGRACKNKAQQGSDYCHVHRQAEAPQKSEAEMAALLAELEGLVAQLERKVSSKAPSPFSPAAVRNLLDQNLDRFTPEVVRDLRNSLQGASAEDLMDADTWKGFWYMLSYSAQFQADQWKERLTGRSADAADEE